MAGKSYTTSPLNTAKGSLPKVANNTGAKSGFVINNVTLSGASNIGSQPKSISGQQYVSSPLDPKK